MKNVFTILSLFLATFSFAQITIEQQAIGTAGGFSEGNGISISSTVGETASETKEGGDIILTEGLQQPIRTYIEVLDLYVYSGFSPNSDGINDGWVIDGIDQYPENEIFIYNRWEQEVWSGINYNNNDVLWKGENKVGRNLVDGTYFYVIKIPDMPVEKGWVQITRGIGNSTFNQ